MWKFAQRNIKQVYDFSWKVSMKREMVNVSVINGLNTNTTKNKYDNLIFIPFLWKLLIRRKRYNSAATAPYNLIDKRKSKQNHYMQKIFIFF